MTPNPDTASATGQRGRLAFAWGMARGDRMAWVTSLVNALFTHFFRGLLPIVYALVVDQVITRGDLSLVPALALCFAMLLIANEGMFAIGHVSWVYKITDFDSKVRRRLFRRILSARSESLERRKTGDLAETVEADAQQITWYVDVFGIWIPDAFIGLVIALLFMGAISPLLALMAAIAAPLSGAILGLLALLGASFAVRSGSTVVRNRATARFGAGIAASLRAAVFDKIQSLPLSFLTSRTAGDLATAVSDDTRDIRVFLQDSGAQGMFQVVLLAGLTTVVLVQDWQLGLMLLAPAPLIVLVSIRIWRMGRANLRAHLALRARAQSVVQDVLSGIRVVKAFGRERSEVARYRRRAERLMHLDVANYRLQRGYYGGVDLLLKLGEMLVLLVGGWFVLGDRLAVGELVQFALYAAMLHAPLLFMGRLLRDMTQAVSGAERLVEILEQEPDIRDAPGARSFRFAGGVCLDRVAFSYDGYTPALRDLSLAIEPGEMVGLVGHSGAGKSTIVNLLLRLYDVDDGTLSIDGVDVRDIEVRSLRGQMGVVLQDPFLFAGSVLDNIRYGRPDAAPEAVLEAAATANAHDFITRALAEV